MMHVYQNIRTKK